MNDYMCCLNVLFIQMLCSGADKRDRVPGLGAGHSCPDDHCQCDSNTNSVPASALPVPEVGRRHSPGCH